MIERFPAPPGGLDEDGELLRSATWPVKPSRLRGREAFHLLVVDGPSGS
jgi:hypothetical protein